MFFWDYGNAFLLEARRAGADVSPKSNGGPQEDGLNEEATAFRYPSYVQDIMGWVHFYPNKFFLYLFLYNFISFANFSYSFRNNTKIEIFCLKYVKG